MVQLVPMREDDYQRFFAWAVEDYAQEQVKAGAWPEENANALAQQAFEARLPDGLSSANQFLFRIEREEDGEQVGELWWGFKNKVKPALPRSMISTFIMNIAGKDTAARPWRQWKR